MPAIPTVTYADQADGTGATVTIAGSDAGSTNTLYTARWDAGWANLTLASAGSRTGDGTIDAALSDGLHLGQVISVLSGDSAASVVKGFRTTSGDYALHYQICIAVQSVIQALALTNIPSAKVVVMKLPWRAHEEIAPKGIIITPIRETRQPTDNARDEVSYRTQISHLAVSNQKFVDLAGVREQTMWRQRIADAFSENTLTGVTISGVECVKQVRVTHGNVFIPDQAKASYDVGSLLLDCLVDQERGIF